MTTSAWIVAVMVLTVAWVSQARAQGKAIETVIQRGGLSATVYVPSDGKPHPALLVLGGAEGGRDWAEAVAKRFEQEGYVAMAQSYFKAPGLPDQLENIPLERFQAAIDYLQERPFVEKKHIAAVGLSKGAEAVLVLAARDARVTAVVAASPSDVVWQGIGRKGGAPASSWTYQDKPLAYVSFKPCLECKGLLDLYRNSRDARRISPASTIAVENINGPILLISSAEDQVWPSKTMANSIIDRLHRSGFHFNAEKVDYPTGGHFAFGIPPTKVSAKDDTEFGGGSLDGLAKARQDSWQRVLRLLATTFAATRTPSPRTAGKTSNP